MQLIYNVVLVSSVQLSNSVIYRYMYILFKIIFHMDSFFLPFKFMVPQKYVFKNCIFKTNLISCSLLLLTGKGYLLCRNCMCILLCMLWACLKVMALSTTFHSHTLVWWTNAGEYLKHSCSHLPFIGWIRGTTLS